MDKPVIWYISGCSLSTSQFTTLRQHKTVYYPQAAWDSLLPSGSMQQFTTLRQHATVYYPQAAWDSLLPSGSMRQFTILRQHKTVYYSQAWHIRFMSCVIILSTFNKFKANAPPCLWCHIMNFTLFSPSAWW